MNQAAVLGGVLVLATALLVAIAASYSTKQDSKKPKKKSIQSDRSENGAKPFQQVEDEVPKASPKPAESDLPPKDLGGPKEGSKANDNDDVQQPTTPTPSDYYPQYNDNEEVSFAVIVEEENDKSHLEVNKQSLVEAFDPEMAEPLKSELEKARSTVGDFIERAKARESQIKEDLSQVSNNVTDQIEAIADQVSKDVADKAEAVTEQAEDCIADTQPVVENRLQQAQESFVETVEHGKEVVMDVIEGAKQYVSEVTEAVQDQLGSSDEEVLIPVVEDVVSSSRKSGDFSQIFDLKPPFKSVEEQTLEALSSQMEQEDQKGEDLVDNLSADSSRETTPASQPTSTWDRNVEEQSAQGEYTYVRPKEDIEASFNEKDQVMEVKAKLELGASNSQDKQDSVKEDRAEDEESEYEYEYEEEEEDTEGGQTDSKSDFSSFERIRHSTSLEESEYSNVSFKDGEEKPTTVHDDSAHNQPHETQ
ncbi:hypothetical protein TCAL_03207 [Tigriopus californicus]|uniref:Uncharacterized protein n=1 Tax=Tigriopus californicus TaxID=6832 RepID=A0A553N756_TIGCA|nr:sodium/potassium/calcium exchanger 1-like [Tigriopus californicus]TRY61233.1 hypothetical protein TCAL_03207 [Tigriopus californicus]|eukprot:TCALIF_03207-PA protein Name:"Protein of unknown function" AED:0.35 eAED:0.35 QI:131/1/1/1/1/1/2/149/476